MGSHNNTTNMEHLGVQFHPTDQARAQFTKDGFLLVRSLLDQEEIQLLRNCLETSSVIKEHAFGRSDGLGASSKFAIWNQAGDDVSGVVVRSEKIAGTMEFLLGGEEIYHYHSKLMMKEPKTGGAHLWHQDYGYWYQNGILTPDMGSVFIPVDPCTRNNSCLQVLRGSHKMGRLDHFLIGDQSGADLERVEAAKERCEHIHVEMKPGDVLFFHSNLLHTSDQNHSTLRRWVLITSFCQARNNPTREHHCPRYSPMTKVENTSIKECKKLNSSIDQMFMDPSADKSDASLPKL